MSLCELYKPRGIVQTRVSFCLHELTNPFNQKNSGLEFLSISGVDRTERQFSFFSELTRLQNQGFFRKTIPLSDFYDLYQYSLPIDLIISGYFFLKKEQQRDDHGNAINFIADTAESGIILGDCDDILFSFNPQSPAFQEIVNNLVALVAEHPLAEATKRGVRVERWDHTNGPWRLRSQFGYVDSILDRAILSSQKLGFEEERFVVNKENYQMFRKGRKEHDLRPFVEFSPSPAITHDAVKRGYVGNDCIFIFSFNPDTGEERVEQRWLRVPLSEFVVLLDSLGCTINNTVDDVEIMRHSNFFSNEQLCFIEAFIDRNNKLVLSRLEDIFDYIDQDLRPWLQTELNPVLLSGAEKLIAGYDISDEIEAIIATLSYAQLKLKAKISEISGEASIGAIIPTELVCLDSDLNYRISFVKENKIPLVGCGVNTRGHNSYGIPRSIGDTIFAKEDEYGSLEFPCPHCGKIIVRPYGKLVSICDNPMCGKNVRCT